MKARLHYFNVAPTAMKAMLDLEKSVAESGLEQSLIKLVKIRASQINGCGYCIHMHTREARDQGESEERLYVLSAWRQTPLYSDRERAALEWTEALTLVAQTHASDEAYHALQAQFSPEEQVKLSLLIVAINGWNRLAIGFKASHS